uniref:NADH dehydrogenase subunit 2 n=1 Tax=Gammarus nipponensis TaxID=353628 RepID=UPI00286AAD0B|nr:NADH dehydrogenase subunit 2 [Gammarus nipponensis]WLS55469.1 NADH dehydrogenase subunit 2 [Gammarus nipponensis]
MNPYHPAHFLFLSVLLLSTILSISANSWSLAWMGLEVSLMAMVPLITAKKNKYSMESALKYFLIQALGSIFIITTTSTPTQGMLSLLITFIALALKSGAAPSHQWYPAMVEGLSWLVFTILATIQKIAPMILIFFLLKTNMLDHAITFYIFCSAAVGAVGGLTQNSLRKIVTYSSIAHTSWLLLAISYSSWSWVSYFFTYSFILVSLTTLLSHSQVSTLNHLTTTNQAMTSISLASSILSLGGLPPFTGFLPKFLLVQQLVHSTQATLLIPLLISTFISLLFYLRLLLSIIMLISSTSNNITILQASACKLLVLNLLGLISPTLVFLFL